MSTTNYLWYKHGLIIFLAILIKSASGKPNIVLIVADDLGWGDVSFHGSQQVRTPNIDALAARGQVLNNYYVSPLCSPTRSALLSARHPIHTGFQHDVIQGAEPWAFPIAYQLLPQYLKDVGYVTRAVGKWHLGFYRREYWPQVRGFDSFFGFLTGHGDHFDHSGLENEWGLDLRRDFEPVAHQYSGQYSTDIYKREAVDIIGGHNRTSPLFLYLAFQAVHAGNAYAPLQVPIKYIDRFRHISDHNRRTFVGMVSALDDAIGQVVKALQDQNMMDNTIIILTTDNGGATGGALGRIDGSFGSNWPLRGTKYTLWEGGVRAVGLIASKHLAGGRIFAGLFHVADWLPTLYEAIGGQLHDLPHDLYGVSHWSQMRGKNKTVSRNEMLHNLDDEWGVSAIRVGHYKLVSGTVFGGKFDGWFLPPGESFFSSNNTFEHLPLVVNCSRSGQASGSIVPCDLTVDQFCLFDLSRDPCEQDNIASSLPTVVNELQTRLAKYNASATRQLNVPADPIANPVHHGYYWDAWR